MVLTRNELIGRLQPEVRFCFLCFQPRSLRELLPSLTVFVPIHLRTIHARILNLDPWRAAWQKEEAAAAKRNLAEVKDCPKMEMSGQKAGIGSWLVWMLCHYAAYRMLLLLYVKACGCDELGTLDLGLDTIPGPQQLDQMEGKCNE